jgi:hypothetical protein
MISPSRPGPTSCTCSTTRQKSSAGSPAASGAGWRVGGGFVGGWFCGWAAAHRGKSNGARESAQVWALPAGTLPRPQGCVAAQGAAIRTASALRGGMQSGRRSQAAVQHTGKPSWQQAIVPATQPAAQRRPRRAPAPHKHARAGAPAPASDMLAHALRRAAAMPVSTRPAAMMSSVPARRYCSRVMGRYHATSAAGLAATWATWEGGKCVLGVGFGRSCWAGRHGVVCQVGWGGVGWGGVQQRRQCTRTLLLRRSVTNVRASESSRKPLKGEGRAGRRARVRDGVQRVRGAQGCATPRHRRGDGQAPAPAPWWRGQTPRRPSAGHPPAT